MSNQFFCWRTLATSLALVLATTSISLAFNTVIETTAGLDDDAYATGRIIDSTTAATLADWSLTTTVSENDFANDKVTAGPLGLEYVMVNAVAGSSDVNSIGYSVIPVASHQVGNISISQSPYFNTQGTWNGGSSDAAQFEIIWAGGEAAFVQDPDDQIFAFATDSPIISGTTVRFNDVNALNDSDSWSVILPAGVDSVQLNWSSASPQVDSPLTREWVTFDASFEAVPEPAALGLLGLAMLGGLFYVRHRG